jgi:hypothetical protein
MRNDFCALILSHGRPDNVKTFQALRKHGYTGKIFVVIDDEDQKADEYRKIYKDQVVQFCKSEMVGSFDIGDNIKKRNTVIFARNQCHDLARRLGFKYFIELDDDYGSFQSRYSSTREYVYAPIRSLDTLFDSMVKLLDSSKALSVCLSQGGDHIGGQKKSIGLTRKAMNTFVCDVDRPFQFVGRMNDDVNTYVTLSHRGNLFFTIDRIQVVQSETQQQSGGLTEMYLELGTYMKSFYTVMMAPSAVKIGVLKDSHSRIHHAINWRNIAPKIIREEFKKPIEAVRKVKKKNG